MTKLEIIEAIIKCQQGDKNALAKVYDEYFGRMCVTAFGIVKNADAAYDIASNVILKLLEFRSDFSNVGNPIGYIIRMVRNEAYDYISKRRREVNAAGVWECKCNDLLDMLWLEDILIVLTEKERELFELLIIWDMSLKEALINLGIA